MMKAYEWMLDHTDWQVKTVGGVWLLMHITRWLAMGCVFGLLFCLGTGSSDYQKGIQISMKKLSNVIHRT